MQSLAWDTKAERNLLPIFKKSKSFESKYFSWFSSPFNSYMKRVGVTSVSKYTKMASVQFSCSVMSDSLRPHESQHARPPCPSPTPRVHSDSCPLSQWCHPAISPSVVPFSSCPQSLPASQSFPMGQLFASGSQSTGVSTLASFLPKKSQDWSPSMDWVDLLAVQGTLKSLLQHHSSKASILWCSAFFTVQLSHPYMTTGKTIALTRRT